MNIFYQLLVNNTLAGITNFTVWFALVFYIYLQSKSVFATSVISGMFLVATAVSGFWFGSLVDHNKKKTVMILSSIVSLTIYIISFGIYLSAPVNGFSQITSMWLWLFIPLVLMGVIAGNIRNIALPTIITFLISEDKRDKANGMAGTAGGVSFLITSVISGFLVGHSGMYGVFILALGMTLVTLIHLWILPLHEKAVVQSSNQVSKIDIKGTINAIKSVPGLFSLIFFTMFNNFLGGIFMSLMDAYGLSLVPVQVWGVLWGFLSIAFILGGLMIAKWGLGKNPLRVLFLANIIIWTASSLFTIQPSIILLTIGAFIYLSVMPYIEAAEHTIIQKVVKPERQGRVFGFAQSVEQAASPLTAFAIGPIAQFIFIPFMTTGAGVNLIGSWFGTGTDRGIALVFTLTGIIGLTMTLIAMQSRPYKQLSARYNK